MNLNSISYLRVLFDAINQKITFIDIIGRKQYTYNGFLNINTDFDLEDLYEEINEKNPLIIEYFER